MNHGEGDRKWLYLGYLQGDSVRQNIPKGLLQQRGIYTVVVGARGRISRCRSSLQMSKYAVNHSEDLRALKCFLTESVSQPSSPGITKTLIGVFRLVAAAGAAAAALDHPSPPTTAPCTIPRLCKHKAETKMASFQTLSNWAFCLKPGECRTGRTNYLFGCASPFP